MIRLSKNQRFTLEEALRHAERALAYINQPTVEVCRHSNGTTSSEYAHCAPGEPSHLMPMAKDIGSDLCGLQFTIRGLRAFLKEADEPSARQLEAQERANDRHTYRQETGHRE